MTTETDLHVEMAETADAATDMVGAPRGALLEQGLVTRIVEAALLASTAPMSLAALQALFGEDDPPPAGSIETALALLQDASTGRGVELVEVASGWRYQVQADVHPYITRMWTERKTKYTRATLETLALIAYRQPITRGEIEAVRGVAVSSNIIQALEEREWIRVVGHRDVPGKPALFGTTRVFLDYFGLKRLDELPPLSEIRDLGELEPQLPFDTAPVVASLAAPASDAGMDDVPGDVAVEAGADTDAQAEPDALTAPDDGSAPDEVRSETVADEAIPDIAADAAPSDTAPDATPNGIADAHGAANAAPDAPHTNTAAGDVLAADPTNDDATASSPSPLNDPEQDNAVATTTVHPDEAASDDDRPEHDR